MSSIPTINTHALTQWVAATLLLMDRAGILPAELPDVAAAITKTVIIGLSDQDREAAEHLEQFILETVHDLHVTFRDTGIAGR